MQNKKNPERKCTGCQTMKPKKELIRVVKTKENTFCIDTTGKMNGRGAYICNNEDCFNKALKNKGLERSFKCSVPKDIYEQFKDVVKKEI